MALEINNVALFQPRDNPQGLPVFLAVSKAPLNVEDEERSLIPPNFDECDLPRLEALLVEKKKLLVVVHGYNNPEKASEKDVFRYLQRGGVDPDTVVVFYRWPSETMFSNLGTTLSSMPWLMIAMLVLSFFFQAFQGARFLMEKPGLDPRWNLVTSIILGFVTTLIALRALGYFRDFYRASLYASPDLAELLDDFSRVLPEGERLRVSFVAHSMGTVVTTQTIRSLSIFQSATNPQVTEKITLAQLSLVSPDLTIEGLLNRRTTLASYAGRFEEAFIFSNQGDVVVGMISSLANYFSFPNSGRARGSRLATLTLSRIQEGTPTKSLHIQEYGSQTRSNYEHRILVGHMPIEKIISASHRGDTYRRITYVDCTDYVGTDGEPKLCYTWGKWRYRFGLRGWWATINLVQYVVGLIPGFKFLHRDVHSGYFADERLWRMIYGAAVCGWNQGVVPLDIDFRDAQLAILRPDPQLEGILPLRETALPHPDRPTQAPVTSEPG